MWSPSKACFPVVTVALLTALSACVTAEEPPAPTGIHPVTATSYPTGKKTTEESSGTIAEQAKPSATTSYSSATPSTTPSPTRTLYAPEPYESNSIAPLGPQDPFIISRIGMINPSEGWALGGVQQYDTGHVFYTKDGGKTWTEVTPPEPVQNREDLSKQAIAHFVGRLEAYVLYRPSYNYVAVADWYLWHTLDGGQSWNYSIAITPQENGYMYPFGIELLSNGFGYLFLNAPTTAMQMFVSLSTTHDHGLTWNQVLHPHLDEHLNRFIKTGIDFVEPNHGWMSIDNLQLVEGVSFYSTLDGGVSWIENTLPAPDSAPEAFSLSHECFTHSPTLFSAQQGIIAVDCSRHDIEGGGSDPIDLQDYLYVTDNWGETWVPRPYPGGELFFLNREIGWALGREIYKTSDSGHSWEHVKRVNWRGSFSIVTEQLMWAVATSDGEIALVKSTDGGLTWQILDPVLNPR